MSLMEQKEFILRKIEERERKLRRNSIIFTLTPIILAVVLIWFSGTKLVNYQKELSNMQREFDLKQRELKNTQDKLNLLDTKFSQIVSKLSKIVAISHEIEEFIERKESFLRTLDESLFLINIRMLFDSINSQFSEVFNLLSGMPDLNRNRIWITIVKSSKSLKKLKEEAYIWIENYGKDQVAIFLSSNKYYALALKGDGSFTTAYRLTVKLQQEDLAYDAYFAASKNWQENFLE